MMLGGVLFWHAAALASEDIERPLVHSWPERKVAPQELAERVPRPIVLRHRCEDRRYPRLSGPFLLHCGPTGEVDRFLDLSTGDTHELVGLERPFTEHRGVIYALGREQGIWRLPATRPEGEGDFALQAVTPAAFDGERVAVGHADQITVFLHGEKTHKLYDARPAPWYPPALPEGWMVWVDWASGRGELRALQDGARHPVLFARGRRHQAHPVADGRWLVWIDDGDVVLADTEAQIRHRWRTDAGHEGPPALFDRYACWGERTSDGEQVRCSDGFTIDGRMPSIWGALTLVKKDDEHVTLYAARFLELLPSDPRLMPVPDEPRFVEVAVEPLWGDGAVTVSYERRGRFVDAETVSTRWDEAAPRVRVPADSRVRLTPADPVPEGL